MVYIVGLGNPGKEYEGTRHNVGWMSLDEIRKEVGFGEPVRSSKFSGNIVEGVLGNDEAVLLYPDTFMNNSGSAVKKLVPKDKENELIVIYDDVDVPVGEVKISFGKGDGGHNGIKSIIAELGSKEFTRIRIGIAPKSFWTGKLHRPRAGAAMTRHVLGKFSSREKKDLESVFSTVVKMLQTIREEGVDKAMNTYN